MSQPSPPPSPRPPLTDSFWFWMMLFCGMGMVILAGVLPGQYAKRQRRLEMQYQARQEIARRQVEGSGAVREPGEEGSAPPPEPGELIISLGPLLVLLGLLFTLSATLCWRARRPRPPGVQHPSVGGGP